MFDEGLFVDLFPSATGRPSVRAVDSMVLDDAVATQDTVTQLIGAIRRVVRQVPGAAAVVTERCAAHDYTDPGKPRIDWDDRAARGGLVSALVADALALLAAFTDAEGLDESASGALALLALVAGQDVEPADGSDGTDGRWRIARRVPDRHPHQPPHRLDRHPAGHDLASNDTETPRRIRIVDPIG